MTDRDSATREAALRDAIVALAAGATVETSPRHVHQAEAAAPLLPPDTPVHVAWVSGTPPEALVAAATRLRAAGLEPVPHIAARELPGEREAGELLARLHAEAGATGALLIAGDAGKPRGPYPDSVALLRSGLLGAHGFRRVGIAGYPEGHPSIDAAALWAALEAKADHAVEHGLDLFVVTQFYFDGAAIVDWVRRLRERGIDLPVRVGLSGPARLSTLVRYGLRCGIGNSLRFLTGHARQAAQLATTQGPEPIVWEIARADPALGIAGLHFFTFGGFADTARWLQRVSAGGIRLGEGDGFRVLEG